MSALLLLRRRLLPPPALDANFATMTALPSFYNFARTGAAWDFNSQGILTQFNSGVPRLGGYRYDPVAGSWFNAGIDVEQAHTNLISTSAGGFNGANWTKTNVVVTDSNVDSPGGASTGSTWADNSTNNNHFINTAASLSFTNATVYTHSVFAKAGTDNRIQLTFGSSPFSTNGYANFNLSTGAVTATGGTLVGSGIIPMGAGWYRCWIAETATATSTAVAYLIRINSDSAARLPTYAGTGTTILIWQADVIAASLPLTPVPTTSGSVTVNAETLSIPLSSIGIPANPTGITVLGKFRTAASTGTTNGVVSVNDGTTSNRLMLFMSAAGTIVAQSSTGGATQFTSNLYATAPSNLMANAWISAAPNNFAGQVIGQTKQTSSSGTMPTGLTTLNIGSDRLGVGPLNSTISRLVLYNSRLPDSVAAQKASGL